MTTRAARLHMGRIKGMRCICCELLDMPQDSATDVHHIRAGQGGAQRADDWLTVPLCHETHHQGPKGIHGDRSYLRLLKMAELDLLAATLERLYG